MKKSCASRFALCLGLIVTLGLTIMPVLTAADAQPVVGNWEGTLDLGAQTKSLHGIIDYPDENASGIAITAITYKERPCTSRATKLRVRMTAK